MKGKIIGIMVLMTMLLAVGVMAGAAGSYATSNISSSSDIDGTENFNLTVASGAFNSNISLYIQQSNETGWTFVTSAENGTDVDEYIVSMPTTSYIEGTYTLNFTAYQDNAETYNAGNYTTLTAIAIDNSDPTVVTSSPASGGSLTSDTNTITATVSEYADSVIFIFGVDEFTASNDGADNMDWTASVTQNTLTEGTRSFQVKVDGTGDDDDLTLIVGDVTINYADSGTSPGALSSALGSGDGVSTTVIVVLLAGAGLLLMGNKKLF